MYYVKATGQNRFMGYGSYRWLRIRKINKLKNGNYELMVRDNSTFINTTENPHNLKFIKGYYNRQPVSFRSILKEKGY